MSFFGFDKQNDLEEERRRFQEGGASNAHEEDVAVYTWGEESYDGLGDALQEARDDLNDETFGGSGAIGKDFDFSQTALPDDKRLPQAEPSRTAQTTNAVAAAQRDAHIGGSNAAPRTGHTLQSVWDDKSPFSALPRMNGHNRAADHASIQPARHSPLTSVPAVPQSSSSYQPAGNGLGNGSATNLHRGVHTLEEIEAEMRATAAAQQRQQAQAQLLNQLPAQRVQAQRPPVPPFAASPPPRMHPHSQSPRFHQQQQQHQIHLMQLQQQQQQQHLLDLQEQQERQVPHQLYELQEQLRMEELERQHQARMQQIQTTLANHVHLQHQRQSSGGSSPALGDRLNRRVGRNSPAMYNSPNPLDGPFQQNVSYLPQDIQLQQRLLAEMAQAEFINNMQATTPIPQPRDEHEREVLTMEAMRKIMEAEKMDQKRRRKLAKIAHMSRYNDLMTQSDKDFITRIQVSQLVTQDPYADDFYAQVYGAILRSRLGVQSPEDRVLKFGSGGGVGLGLSQKGGGRRQSAMQRMEAQVERIVNNAKLREKEKISLNSLQGALGKTAGRSYKAAPRQLLQVDSDAVSTSPVLSSAHAHISKADAVRKDGEGAAREAARIGREALGGATDMNGLVRKDPLTHRETLVILEQLFDLVLKVEQQRRDQPPPEDVEALEIWSQEFSALVEQLWNGLRVMVPLETSDPHPFISLLTPIKGKRLLPRVARHLGTQQMLTVLTLLVACFSQLDVVRQAPILDSLEETRERIEVDNQTQAFLGSVVQSILPVVAKASLRLVSGLLGLLLDRNDIVAVARTRPGIALLTLFLSRVEVVKQSMSAATEITELPTPEETEQWQLMFDHLFQLLAPHLLLLFPSVRQASAAGITISNVPDFDLIDQPVWQFLAAVALHASLEQQQILVASLREIVLENVTSATKDWTPDPELRKLRLSNVNIFLHALGLDSSQIAV